MFNCDNGIGYNIFQNSVLPTRIFDASNYVYMNWLKDNSICINNIIIDHNYHYNPLNLLPNDVYNISIQLYLSIDFILNQPITLLSYRYLNYIDMIIDEYIQLFYNMIPQITTLKYKFMILKNNNPILSPFKTITNNLISRCLNMLNYNLYNYLNNDNYDLENNNERTINWSNRIYDKPDECPVCCLEINNNENLSCGHFIHKDCIIKSKCTKCPICREEIYLTDDELNKIYNN